MFAAGPKKRHGCLIAYIKAKYTKIEERTVHFNEQEIRFCRNYPSVLASKPLLPAQQERLRRSRVVHLSIDPEFDPETAKPHQEDEEGDETDPDKIITNARTAQASDGLLTDSELTELFTTPLRSAYDEGIKIQRELSKDVTSYGDRVPLMGRKGTNEPEWTSYTHYWKTVLDYIFVIDSPSNPSKITGFVQPFSTKDLDPGIPRKGVYGSNHFSLTAEIEIE